MAFKTKMEKELFVKIIIRASEFLVEQKKSEEAIEGAVSKAVDILTDKAYGSRRQLYMAALKELIKEFKKENSEEKVEGKSEARSTEKVKENNFMLNKMEKAIRSVHASRYGDLPDDDAYEKDLEALERERSKNRGRN